MRPCRHRVQFPLHAEPPARVCRVFKLAAGRKIWALGAKDPALRAGGGGAHNPDLPGGGVGPAAACRRAAGRRPAQAGHDVLAAGKFGAANPLAA